MFYKKENYPESGMFDTCLDCRKYMKNCSENTKKNRKQKAEEQGNFLCYQCGVSKTVFGLEILFSFLFDTVKFTHFNITD